MSETQKLLDTVKGLGEQVSRDLGAWIGPAEVVGYYIQVVGEITQIFIVTPRRFLLWEQTADGGQTQVLGFGISRVQRIVFNAQGEVAARLSIDIEAERHRVDLNVNTETQRVQVQADSGEVIPVEVTRGAIVGQLRPTQYELIADTEDRARELRGFAQMLGRQL